MVSVEFSAKMMESLHFLEKHLLSDPRFTVPRIDSDGNEIKTLSALSLAMGVDLDTAAAYALQGKTNEDLKTAAQAHLIPAVDFTPLEDYGYALDKVKRILAGNVESKGVRMVRTVSGARRFQQPKGSIITDDDSPPLDALVALTNDVPGYEKIGDQSGNVFYVGQENGEWVIRDPLTNAVIHKAPDESDALQWLNAKVGGETDTEEDLAGPKLKPAEQEIVNGLGKERGIAYYDMRKRGIPHDAALRKLKV